MKNTLLILTIFSINLISCQVYPLNTSSSDVPNNAYIKDTNNELDKYIGLWKGNWNGKTIYLEFKKNKRYYSGLHSYYIDEIVGERKIISQNGQVEIDRISNFNLINSEFWGITSSVKNPTIKTFTFFPKNMCGVHTPIDIINITNTTMTLQRPTLLEGHVQANCIHNAYVQQYGVFPVNFPTDITLTKQ